MNWNSKGDPTRRGALRSMIAGSMLMPGIVARLLAEEGNSSSVDPLAPKPGHFPAKAKRVIFLYMSGGVSHIDTWDPKPKLFADATKTIPVNEFQGRKGDFKMFLKRPNWDFKRHGKSGTEVSQLFPQMAECVDDLCVIRSMKSDHTNHYEATLGMHTGSFTFARPSMGSWISYGLGTVNRNLPSFIVIAPQSPYAGGQVWGSDFLPGSHQGTLVVPGAEPVANIKRRTLSAPLQEMELRLLAQMNQRHLDSHPKDPLLEARMRSFETAFGMQSEMPEVFDFSKESDATLKLYGLERGSTKGFAWQCLTARRLIERGVRFVELIDVGSSNNWDAHGDMMTHVPLAKNVDGAIAGLLKDLKQRGLLQDTLVVWTTEFGRTPFNSAADAKGREHHHWVFSSWLAGAGVKPGITFGESDEYGINVAKDPVHVHDFHATILHLMGLDHEKLTYRNSGRDYRLTDIHGRVVKEILA
ncbi:DUF1501 domain-containing protein [Telmatocola sphagniphila]|uniref:DUF1501 domain-containing protein n=1 Tax=Telmatocola sphagniphila TaxID=1123043 RepID=A0A8E6B7A2_9BACT|nr:DUF1501 domain-containing protein [Telmatocola sphagniphila]QVL33207.1 DUF1501 domain-containing protein [Telmatocola sphagniphila]